MENICLKALDSKQKRVENGDKLPYKQGPHWVGFLLY